MNDELLPDLIARLQAKVPELMLIDEDYGQLETDPGEQYPVVFPCALLSAVSAEYTAMGIPRTATQRATAEITVRVAMDCYDDTHAGSGTTGRITERARLNSRVVQALHGYRPQGSVSPMVRIRSQAATTPYNWKIYETTFRWEAVETIIREG